MLAIRLSDEIESRLDSLAKQTGRTKTFYAREAILAHLEDLRIIIFQQKLLHAFAVVMKQCIRLKT
ncbi:TraY domain-containing protein [Klebsiella pneumoniae]|uniref:type II toxin-antitoxin system RelB family antitoxin n=1 Tax=Klebsiella pneumoniae TaxID=573 RepID=UPI0022B64A2F|nr:TraY domain-containing protein [Klebsiella pneumoniae]